VARRIPLDQRDFRDGRIAERWAVRDDLAMLRAAARPTDPR